MASDNPDPVAPGFNPESWTLESPARHPYPLRIMPPHLFTAGHSNKPVTDLITMLSGAGVHLLVDVRMFPMSRRWPQFNREALTRSLADAGIDYRHAPELGGRRKPDPDS